MNKTLKNIIRLCILAITLCCSSIMAVPTNSPKDGLIVVPSDDKYGAARSIFTGMINDAKKTIDLSMYQLKDQDMIESMVKAVSRGVKIRLFTEKKPYQHAYNQDKNDKGGLIQLEKAGIPIKTLPPILSKNKSAQAHHKVLIVDGEYAVVMSCNWDTPTLANTRDFAVIIKKNRDPNIFSDIVKIFNADWANIQPSYTSRNLVVGPDHQREKFLGFLKEAKYSIDIYQQSYNDPEIASALEKIARSGIKVRLLMMPFPFGGEHDKNAPFQNSLVNAGGKVHLLKTRYVHAKAIIIDDKKAYIGSCNFYPPSLDYNRELGVIISNQSAIKRLKNTFEHDWKLADPIHQDER